MRLRFKLIYNPRPETRYLSSVLSISIEVMKEEEEGGRRMFEDSFSDRY